MGMRPCRFRVRDGDQEIFGGERMELKADDRKRTEPGIWGGLKERMESDG